MTPPKRSFRLSQKRRDLLDNLLAPAAERIPRQAERGSFPLSFAQQRLWFLDQLEPGNTVYNLPFAVMLEGELGVSALRASLAEVVRRHEALRTRFLGFEGRPLQVVEPPPAPGDLPLPVIDLAGLPEAARQGEADPRQDEAGRLVRGEVALPFDLAAGPVFRFRLARLAADRHLAVFSLHHIAADGWSIGVLIQELAALYPAFLEGRPSPLPELEIQYADFAVWQRGWLEGERLERQLAFWKERLAGAPERLRLATDHPRPEAPDYRGGTRPLALPADLSHALRGLAQREEGTLFMVLLAAYAVLLSRHSGQEDVVVGSPIANRNRAQLEPLIGFFVNTLALRVDLSADPPFRALLREVRDLTLGAYAHQDLPLERLVDELGVRRELDHAPLFQVLLTLQNAPVQALRLPGLSLAPVAAEGGATRFDLTLSLGEGPGGAFGGTLYYRADLFDAPTVDRLLVHFQVLLAGIAAGSDRRLSDLPVLAEPERLQLLAEWNDTRAAPPRDLGLHRLIAARAAEAPDAVAVEMGEERLTYGDLDRRANRLARHLSSLGGRPEARVGVLLERSPDLVAVLLAVLKAGAAYLPLDPAHPAERLVWLLRDAGASLTVTCAGLLGRLPEGTAAVCLDRDAAAIEGRGGEAFDAWTGPDSLAYVLYTSGSTGRPKGVMVPHRGVVSYLAWAAGAYGMTPGAAAPVHSPLGFDLTVTSLFAPLIAGGRVVLIPEGPGIEALGEALLRREDGFALVKLTPAHLALLRDFLGPETGRVRRFVVGGEALLWESFAFLGDAGDTVRVVNEYGPTEATVGCCVEEVAPRAAAAGPVPIGRPIANARLHLLDAWFRPVPAGVPGELWIGGDGLARGYLGQPDLTAASFVPDPFPGIAGIAGEPGARLYRSGDLAWRLLDGRLEFLRRIDDQLKVRGFRIEPGEVEAALLRHPAVAEAAVVARQGEGGERRLVACVVPAGEATQDLPAELRAFLKDRLPEPLIPAGFLLLEALPLTGNGKVDRRALEQLDESSRAAVARESAAPRNPAEEVLARIWAEVLGLPGVGIHDNFFELGGDSILSLQVAARARKKGLKILSRQMFQHQTVAELAAVADPLAPAGAAAATPDPSGPVPVPLTPIQRWFFEREQPEVHHYNQAVLLASPASRERWDGRRVERALAAVIRRHDVLRLRFHRGESGWRQELLPAEPAGAAPFARLDLSALPARLVSEAIQAATAALQASLDLQRGPLLRVARFEPGRDEPDRLLIAVHHLAIDAVSWRVLLEDLQAACRQPETPLPAPPTSFREWAERLERHAGSEEVARELDLWLDRPAVSPLPRDGAADGGTVDSAAGVAVRLEPEETTALVQEVPRVYRTRINDALLAALARAFAARTGEPRLLVDLEGHGREEVFDGVDLSRTVGWFTSLFPVALEVPPGGGPGAALKAVQETLRAVPGRGLGYGLLRYGRPETAARLAALPEPEVLFNYLGQLDSEMPGSTFSAAPEGSGPAISPRWRRRHLFEINGAVAGGRLQVAWTFNPAAHRRETVEALAAGFAAELRALVASCREQVARLEAAGRLEDFYSLSPMQQGLLFHALADPDSAAYFEQQTCALTGNLDEAAFRRAWERVVERHAVLRTGFVWEGLDEPLQAVRERVELPWESLDWRGLEPAGQREGLEALLTSDRERGFDLTKPPLTRLTLIQLEKRRWQLVWSHHHLLLDGWSVPRLLHEVAAFYAAFRRGEELDLPRPRPYRDYVAWLSRQDEKAEEAFWRETLRGFGEPTPLELGGTDRSRGGEGQETLESVEPVLTFDLPEEPTAALAALGRRLQVTPNTLVLGAWALLLARYASRDDVVFGATTSGRPAQLDGVEGMVGLMINTSPVRVRVAPAAPLGAWLGKLQDELAEQRQHEHAPLARVQRWSEVPPGRPLFESLFVFENYPAGEALAQEGPGLAMSGFRGFSRTNYPLTLSAATGERLGFRIAWDPARFAAESVSRLTGHLLTLLEGMASLPPERPLADLPLLTAAERSQLLTAWGPGPAAPAILPPVHESFAAWAARTPEALAVADGGERLTYGELNRRAERLARRLRNLGVGPEVPVAVCFERSAGLVVGALAVLKAGGAYVPLDPLHPRERLAGYLDDLGEPGLVTRRDLAAVLPEGCGRQVVFLDEMDPDDGPPVETSRDPGRCAYVIFTSGSTGRPKGVQVEHRGLANVVRWAVETYGIGPGDRMTQVASPGFDASVLETWMALTSGGALLIPDEPTRSSPAALVRWLAAEGVTHSLMPTPLAESALEEPWPGGLVLNSLLTGGDRLVRRPAAGFPLFNHYGPTEATILTTAGPVEPAPAAGLPDIGHPIHGTRIHLLDLDGGLVPAGIPGELCVGGAGVARGYLGRPHLTAERFVPDPFGAEPGGRLYRTGDLARWLPDGRVDFLGRLDRQVKLRGVRIELGEIEARLAAHPEVREAAVALLEDGGERRLVAWVVPRGPQSLDAAGLREHLRRGLPEAMVPAVFVALDALPLTPAGKVDRAALPAPHAGGGAGDALHEAYAPPRTAAETTLARIWEEVLGVERVGVRDDFFALGGDSILSLQIVARAGRAGLRLSPRQLFEHPSVAELAAVAAAAPATAAEQGPVTGPVPLTPIQRWFFELGFPSPHHFNQAALFEVRRRLDPARLAGALGAVILHHDALRMRYAEDGTWRQWIDPPGAPEPSSSFDLTALPAARRRAALEQAAADLQASLDLGRGPLLRAGLFDLGPQEPQRLLLTVHHLVVDGVSWRILLEDLQAAYAGTVPGEEPRLPRKTTSFRAWAKRLAAYAEGPEVAAEAAWWTDPARSHAEVPAEALAAGADGEEGILSVALEAEETRALLQEVPRAYRTRIDDVLLTALASAFREVTGAGRLRVDLEGHGREELFEGVDVSRTVGWFTTMYPVLLETTGELAVDLKAVKERLRAVPGRGIGYGLLRFLGDPETAGRLREQPAATVSFNYLGQFDATLDELGDGFFRPARESAGPLTAPDGREGPAAHPLQVSGMVVGGRLRLDWAFTGTTCSRAAAGRLAAAFPAALRDLIAHCRDPRVFGHTPSDFPLARLDQDALDRLVEETGRIEDLYPLSPLQQGMLLYTLMAPASPESRVGFEQIACRLQGGLDPDAFRRAWQRVLDRHPALRSGIFWRGLDEPLQAVFPSLPLDFREEDWRGRPDPERRLEQALASERRRGFDLSRPPLLRLGLFRIAADAWFFALSSHHILQDGWSLSLIFRDLFDGYEACRHGLEPAAGEAPRYRDYIAWLRRQDLAEAEAFWRGELAGFAALTPLVRTLPAGEPGTGAAEARLDPPLVASLQALARRCQVTLNTLVQAAWGLILARATGRDDVVFGTTVSGRPADLPGVEATVGLFINNLPVRVTVAAEAPFAGWLRGVRDRQAEAARFEHTPLALVQSWSGTPAGQPLFDNLLVFENYPVDTALQQGEGSLQIRDVRSGVRANYPFTLVVEPGAAVLLQASYDRRFFDAPAAVRLLERLRAVLAGFVEVWGADPSRPVGLAFDLPALREIEPVAVPVAAAAPAPGARPDYLAPRTPLELAVAQAFEAALGHRPVGVRDDFFAFGGHSLLALHLVAEIRRRLGRELPLGAMVEGATPELLARRLAGGPEPYRPVLPLQPAGSRPPLFCVHPGGGNVLGYLRLARHLGEDQPVYGVQTREGLAGDGDPPPSLPEMAAHYVAAIREVQPAGPYRLAGWSFGGLAAFEMARQLREAGEEVALLASFDQGPRLPPAPEGYDETEMLVDLSAGECPVTADELRRVGDIDEQILFLIGQAQSRGHLQGIGLAEGRTMLRIWRRHLQAGESYRPLPYPGGVTLFRCERQPEGAGPTLGWDEVALGGVEVLPVPGEHSRLMEEPYVGELAARLRTVLGA